MLLNAKFLRIPVTQKPLAKNGNTAELREPSLGYKRAITTESRSYWCWRWEGRGYDDIEALGMQVSWLVLKIVGWGWDIKSNSVSFLWIHIVWETLNWHLSTWSALPCGQRGIKTDLEVYSSILPREKFSNYLGIKGWVLFSTFNPQLESGSMQNSRLAMWGRRTSTANQRPAKADVTESRIR